MWIIFTLMVAYVTMLGSQQDTRPGKYAMPDAPKAKADSGLPLPQDAPIPLKASWSKQLTMPSFMWGDLPQCDAEGNLYFHAAVNVNDSIILKLKDDSSHSIYVLPNEDASKTDFVAFRVSRDGTLRLLAHERKPDRFIVYKFNSDGEDPTSTVLDSPAGLSILNFQALSNGHVVAHGYLDINAERAMNGDSAGEKNGRSFFGEFDPSGKLLRKSEDKASELIERRASTWVGNAAVAESDDGQSYLLAGENILVLSATGELIRTIPLHSPHKDFDPVNIFAAGPWLLVAFFSVEKQGSAFSAMYELIDRSTGEQLRTYVPDKELGNNLVCFSSEGFTFYGVENRHVKMTVAKP
jgi:hypothetical protein